jgi:lipopolysaccharide export system permease protein
MPIRPTRIDRYVLLEVLGPFLGGVFFFSFVFLMFQALRLSDFFIIHGVSLLVLLELASLMILSFLPIALPIAFLIGVLVGFGRLSSDSELVAMKANGISVLRLSAPVLALALLVSLLSLGLNMEWVPAGDRLFKRTIIRVSNTKVASAIREGAFTTGFFDLLLYTDKHDSKSGRMQRVFIFDERDPKNPLAVVAQEGEILPVQTESRFGSANVLRLMDGSIHINRPSEDAYQKMDFSEYRLFLKIDEGADNAQIKPRMLPYHELQDEIQKNPPTTGPGIEFRGEFSRRLAVAISPIVFVFLGMGFGTVRTRAVRAGAALIALAVILTYWSIQAGATVASQKGWVPPMLAMQIPNLLTGLVAIRAFKSANW